MGKADVFEVRLEDKNVCALAKGAAPSGGSKGEGGKSMSGTGIFFLTIFVTTFAYFVIGSMYNYSVQRSMLFLSFHAIVSHSVVTDFPEMIPHIDAIKLGASKLIVRFTFFPNYTKPLTNSPDTGLYLLANRKV